jgi:WD40 repeat protein
MSEPDTPPPPAGDDPAAVLALIGAEMALRLRRGESPDVEDYCRRFPALAGPIRERWALALAGSEHESPATVAPGGKGAEAILAAVGRAGLVEPEQLRQLAHELAGRQLDAQQLGRELMHRGWATAFQLNQLFQGRETALHVGPYLLLARLGAGGMGQVFKARHRRLGRIVALKLIHPQYLGDPGAAKRFLREVRSLSRLDHPHIVRALDAGEADGRLYLVMEYVEGTDLAQLVNHRGALPLNLACECARQSALALQHAHENGLVHRDIKPSNLLLAGDGTVRLLDLGLARPGATDESDAGTTLTDTGMMMGTPDYVAPEQILDSKRVDIRADLYSLGCTLYHLLTGRPPFAGGTAGQKLVQQQTEEPEAIAALRPEVPAALVAVVQKLMAKKPDQRYQTPAELAAVLDHLLRTGKLRGGPFAGLAGWAGVVPASWLGRPRPSWQGRRLLAALVVAVLLVGSAGLVLWLWPAPQSVPIGKAKEEQVRPPLSPLDDLAFEKIVAREREGTLLKPETVQVLGTHQGQHGSFVRCLAFHPDGKRAFSGGSDGVIRVWDTATMFPRLALCRRAGVLSVAVVREPDGKLVLCASDVSRALARWDAQDAQTLRPLGESRLGRPFQCISPDGRHGLWAHAGQTPCLFDFRAERELKRFPDPLPANKHGGCAFTADGKRTLVAVKAGQFAMLETATGKELWRFHGARGVVAGLAMTSDCKRVLSIDEAGSASLWDATANLIIGQFFAEDGSTYFKVTLSADGRRAALLSRFGTVEVWDLEDQRKLRALKIGANTAALTADGRRALTGDSTGRVRLWDLERGKELCSRPDSTGEAYCVALSPDGRLALSGHHERAILHNVTSGEVVKTFAEKGVRIQSVAFSADGSRFAYGAASMLRLYRTTETAKPRWSKQTDSPLIRALVFSQDGRRLFSGGGNESVADQKAGAILAWDTETGKAARPLTGHLPAVRALALSPDGTQLLSGGGGTANRDCTVRLWDLPGRKERKRFQGHKTPVTSVAFAPDGKHAVSVSYQQTILWDLTAPPAKAGRPLGKGGGQAVIFVGGRWVVSSAADTRLVAWTPDGEMTAARALPYQVNGLAPSADDRHLATANGNGTVYILRLPLHGR